MMMTMIRAWELTSKNVVHAYPAAKLGTGLAEVQAERVASALLVSLADVIEAALHGAAAAKEPAKG